MFKRRLLLIALFTGLAMTWIMGQNQVNVHGTVTDASGNAADSVNILISAFYADSTFYNLSVYTSADGSYESGFPSPGPNVLGTVQVSMVDCFGTLVTQLFTIFNVPAEFEANFTYCQSAPIDSCGVYIVEEPKPGALNILTAYTYANVPVEYFWNTGETTQSIHPNGEGWYWVDVAFPWNCTGTDTFHFVIDTFPSCFGYIASISNSDGTYHLDAYGFGEAPFTYAWNTGQTTSSLDSIWSGTYCVTITDVTNCQFSTCVILDPPTCNVYIIGNQNIGLTAIGSGVEPITFVWNTGEIGATIFPNAPGTYCVSMFDTIGCGAVACIDVFNFDSCSVYISPVYIDSSTVGLQAFTEIFNQNVTYHWSTGDTTEIIFPQDISADYCVTVTNSSGCSATACYNSSQVCYAWAEAVYIDTNTAVLAVHTDPIFGWGNNTATYLWSNGDTTANITVHENGSYCVTATLSTSCVTEACVYVDFDSLQYACATWITQFQDSSSNQWYAQAYSWGYGTFSYLWSNGDTNSITPLAFPNEYLCVEATNNFGCVSTACVDTFFSPCQVNVNVNYYSSFATLSANSFFGGALNQGTYTWSNGQQGQVITVFESGTYCVTFNSFSGCSSTYCVDVFLGGGVDSCGVWIEALESPAGIVYTANPWGVSPFTFLWSDGSTSESVLLNTPFSDLCVTVVDAIGCQSSACAPSDTLFFNNSINGYVSADSLSNLAGQVFLYKIDPASGEPYELVDSTLTGLYGFYGFNDVPDGAYLVKAKLILGTVGAAQYIPTYHLSSSTWENANPVLIPNWLPYTRDIQMQHVSGNPGGGIIGGSVIDPHHIVAGGGSQPREVVGVPNVEIILKNENGDPINFTFSNPDGSFTFPDLAFGTYRISYDIPGVHSPDIYVTISQEDPERTGISLVVNAVTSVDQPVAQELSLYPNPAKNSINIKTPSGKTTFDIQIVDMQGRTVYKGSGKSFNGILPVEIGQLSPGVFHINLKGENEFYYSRFLKLE